MTSPTKVGDQPWFEGTTSTLHTSNQTSGLKHPSDLQQSRRGSNQPNHSSRRFSPPWLWVFPSRRLVQLLHCGVSTVGVETLVRDSTWPNTVLVHLYCGVLRSIYLVSKSMMYLLSSSPDPMPCLIFPVSYMQTPLLFFVISALRTTRSRPQLSFDNDVLQTTEN